MQLEPRKRSRRTPVRAAASRTFTWIRMFSLRKSAG
jgi:hypothetical protein